MDNPPKPKPRGRPLSPEQQALINRMKQLTDNSVVFEAVLQDGEKAATVRAQLVRAARLAGVDDRRQALSGGFLLRAADSRARPAAGSTSQGRQLPRLTRRRG